MSKDKSGSMPSSRGTDSDRVRFEQHLLAGCVEQFSGDVILMLSIWGEVRGHGSGRFTGVGVLPGGVLEWTQFSAQNLR